jgi:uncharacterized membrane protein YccC
MTASTPDQRPHRPNVWRQALQSALHVEWMNVEPVSALRCALGVAIALSTALVLHQPAAGVFLAVGAVSAGFGSFQGAYRSRAAIMLSATAGMALSLFVGSLAGRSTAIDCVIASVWGFTAGLLVALGPAASFVGLQSAVAVIVAGAYPADLRGAAGRALLVLGGGLIQTFLVVSLWPLRRFHAERTVVSRAYASLADYARSLGEQGSMPPEPHTFAQMRPVDTDPHPFARSSEVLVFTALLDEAERIRTSLAALSVATAGAPVPVADHLARLLREIAEAMEEGRAPAPLPEKWTALDAAALASGARTTPLHALLGQLRAACRTARVPAVEEPPHATPLGRIRTMPPVRDALMTIRANLSLRSTACRHAIRLAAALAFATAVYRLAAIPRGYWFPMTALLVLKPEYRETFVTGIARMAGTLAGAALAAVVADHVGSHPVPLVVLVVAFVWGGYTLFRANYVLFTVCITGYIVLLLRLAGVPGPVAATYRVIDTLLGGALALAVYRAWPTWESHHVHELLASLAEALGRDARVLLGVYADPSRWNPTALQQTRAAARLARSNAEASVERMLSEPAGGPVDPEMALSLLAAFRRYALGALALHAGLDQKPAVTRPKLDPLGRQIADSLEVLATALRTRAAPGPMPPLVDTQLSVQSTVDPALAEQTGMMIDSITTVAALLKGQ